MSGRPTRLGVASALVAGERVRGDVAVADGCVDAVGLSPPGPRGTALPGFVDWQVNGFGGVDFSVATTDDFASASTALAGAGIVFAAPTLLSMSIDGYVAALGVLAEVRATDPTGGFAGAHLEGPFLSPRWRGAHRAETFADGDPVLVDVLLGAGPVAMVTLAPEVPGCSDLLAGLRRSGVTVSIGHSDATLRQCHSAQAGGATALTHCWNAHRRFAPRDPGPAGWALTSPTVTVGLIADGHHVAPEVLSLTFAAGAGRIALTTDAIAPAGTDAARFGAAGEVTVADGAARLDDGTLAGSVARPTDMIRVLESAGVGFEAIAHALSAPQAAALGLGEWSLRPGDPAHVTVLDEDHGVLQTWRFGRRIA